MYIFFSFSIMEDLFVLVNPQLWSFYNVSHRSILREVKLSLVSRFSFDGHSIELR